MKEYNGHRSYNAWNVALWIDNDEGLYNFALDCLRQARNAEHAARIFMRDFEGQRTPDGAKYTLLSVRLALEELQE